MRMRTIGLVCTIVALSLVSCDKSLETDKRYAEEKNIEAYIAKKSWKYVKQNGVYHVSLDPSYGYQVNIGDTVTFTYKAYTLDEPPIVFDTNIKSEAIAAKLDTLVRSFKPLEALVGETRLIDGVNRGLLLCREGEKAAILFPSDLGFKDRWMGGVPAWSSIVFEVDILSLNGQGIAKEQALMQAIDHTGFTLHHSGLYYRILTQPSGSKPTEQSTVYGWYCISLPDGTPVLESQTPNEVIDLANPLIPALQVGFTLIAEEGGKAELLAPSPLGFGNSGYDAIPPYQPLFLSIRLDSIK